MMVLPLRELEPFNTSVPAPTTDSWLALLAMPLLSVSVEPLTCCMLPPLKPMLSTREVVMVAPARSCPPLISVTELAALPSCESVVTDRMPFKPTVTPPVKVLAV